MLYQMRMVKDFEGDIGTTPWTQKKKIQGTIFTNNYYNIIIITFLRL